jgi:Lrp/AsnC family transcriptional regulator, leucine-responsive regulatory protein
MYSELDLKIIDELQNDSRQGSITLAKKLGVSKSTIHRRINNLISQGAIRFTIVLNPRERGFIVNAYMLIDADADKLEEIAEKLSKISTLSSIVILTGNYKIITIGYFKSIDDVWKVQNNNIVNISGVKSVQTELVLKRVKRAY